MQATVVEVVLEYVDDISLFLVIGVFIRPCSLYVHSTRHACLLHELTCQLFVSCHLLIVLLCLHRI